LPNRALLTKFILKQVTSLCDPLRTLWFYIPRFIQDIVTKMYNNQLEVLALSERDCFCVWWYGSAKAVMSVSTVTIT